jgi:hypothetical protein
VSVSESLGISDSQHPEDPGWQEMPDWGEPEFEAVLAPDEEAGGQGAEASQSSAGETAEERRQGQRKANMVIGEGSNMIPTASIYTLDEILERFLFIQEGPQVAPLDRPPAVLALKDFNNATAGSKHWIERAQGRKLVPAAVAWLEHRCAKHLRNLIRRYRMR